MKSQKYIGVTVISVFLFFFFFYVRCTYVVYTYDICRVYTITFWGNNSYFKVMLINFVVQTRDNPVDKFI